MTQRMIRGSERLQAGGNASSARAITIRAAYHFTSFLATAPASIMLIAAEPLTTDTVQVLSELTIRASRGNLIPMSTTVTSRYASLVAISGPVAIGT
jgi:hypothetical protein